MKKSKILSVVLSSFFCFPATYSLNNITQTTFNPLFKAVEEEQISIPLSELATIDKAYDSPSFSKIKMSCSLDTENLTLSIDKIDSGDIEEDFLNLTFNDTYSYQGKQYSINEIGDNCFSSIQEKYGESLQTHLIGTINFSNSLSSVNNFSFYGLKNVDFAFYSLKYVKKIGNYAFADCDKLCSTYSNYLDLSSFNRLESIGDHAFYNDVNVYTLSLPSNTNSSLTHIYQSAFEGCTNLSGSIKLSGTISFLENDIFKNIKGFSEITFS
ncbi:MAG: leucine-rich repeat domain-containing protein [Mycoplasmoidaceae bacterium]|nr:leucine-rich repeat domain-containing protein [Mycoplasmoidaceae bacterium]